MAINGNISEVTMNQISLFDGEQPLKITKPIRLIELFAGYGSQALALKYLGVPFQSWAICEWAIKSIQAYKDIHFGDDDTDYSKAMSDNELLDYLFKKGISSNYNEPMTYDQIKRLSESAKRKIYNNIVATNNYVNIQQLKGENLEITDTDQYTYLMTYSFPCQDLSLAGNGKGMAKGDGTRSGMLWEVERILDELNRSGQKCLPQILLMENVPQVHSEDNKQHFYAWCNKLESLGYKNYWQDLNSKDYGIPHNRNRCFMVSILGDYNYAFPTPTARTPIESLLEDNVPEKYYLSDNAIEGILNTAFKSNKMEHRAIMNGIVPTLCARDYKDPKLVIIWDDRNSRIRTDGCIGSLVTDGSSPKKNNRLIEVLSGRVRKLTPREYFRLMGVHDEDFSKIKDQSDYSLWHLAGDSIVINVLMAIFRELL